MWPFPGTSEFPTGHLCKRSDKLWTSSLYLSKKNQSTFHSWKSPKIFWTHLMGFPDECKSSGVKCRVQTSLSFHMQIPNNDWEQYGFRLHYVITPMTGHTTHRAPGTGNMSAATKKAAGHVLKLKIQSFCFKQYLDVLLRTSFHFRLYNAAFKVGLWHQVFRWGTSGSSRWERSWVRTLTAHRLMAQGR